MPNDVKLNQRAMSLESPWGWWTIATNDTHVLSVDYQGQAAPSAPNPSPETKLEMRLNCMLSRYFRGELVDFSRVPVDFSQVSPFAGQVLGMLRTVPYGEVRHYQWIAEQLNKPGAARAVGGALGGNPWPILIPCHRVISKTGALGGFMRNSPVGPSLKTALLGLEGIVLPVRS